LIIFSILVDNVGIRKRRLSRTSNLKMKSRLQTTLGPPRQGPTSLDPPALPRTAALRARAALAGVAEACQRLHVGGPPSLDPPVLPRTVALRARAALAGAVGAAAPGPSRAAEREGEGAGEARQGGGRRGERRICMPPLPGERMR